MVTHTWINHHPVIEPGLAWLVFSHLSISFLICSKQIVGSLYGRLYHYMNIFTMYPLIDDFAIKNMDILYQFTDLKVRPFWDSYPLLTIIPVRSQWGRYNLSRFIDDSTIKNGNFQWPEASLQFKFKSQASKLRTFNSWDNLSLRFTFPVYSVQSVSTSKELVNSIIHPTSWQWKILYVKAANQ